MATGARALPASAAAARGDAAFFSSAATGKIQARVLGWRVHFERAAAPRQGGIGHEIGVRGKSIGILGMGIAVVASVRVHIPALRPVLQQRHHDLVKDLLMDRGVFDGNQDFHPAVQVARHPVGRGNEDLGVLVRQPMSRAETDDAAMLQEAADNGS